MDTFEPVNVLRCDRCGHAEHLPPIEGMEHVSREEAERLLQDRFIALKRAFGAQGWSTSMGYDLCPACSTQTGTAAGYRETDLLPERTVTPKSQKKGHRDR